MNFAQQTQVQKCIEEFYDEIAHDYHKRGTVDEAVRYLLKNIVRRIRQCIADLQTNPYPPNRTEKLSGYRHEFFS